MLWYRTVVVTAGALDVTELMGRDTREDGDGSKSGTTGVDTEGLTLDRQQP